jgi:hypothetical protein
MGEAVGLEALHPPALVVYTNQQVLAYLFDGLAQLRELVTVLPVAGKQNQPTHQRVLEALAVDFGKRQASNVDDERSVLGHELFSISLLFW